jgi:hypothetical protein
LHKAAQERNERARSSFIAKIGENYTRDQLIFLDESSKDERSLTRYYGYSSVNTRAQKKIVFVRGKRYTILPALTIDGIIALDIIEGSCDRKRFVDFILDQVVCIQGCYVTTFNLFQFFLDTCPKKIETN